MSTDELSQLLKPVSRGSRDKKPRAFGGGRSVRVVGEDDVLITVSTEEAAERYLRAPNAEVKRRQDGSIRVIRLRSVGDDRGHLGENHGRSTVTTERVRNDWGQLVGSDRNLKHKQVVPPGNPSPAPHPKYDPNSTRATSSPPGP